MNYNFIINFHTTYSVLYFFSLSFADEDIFRQNIGNQMKIGLAEKGYKRVQLKCGSTSMVINIQTENEFLGVIYTRGSFYNKDSPCFYDTRRIRGQRNFQLNFSLNECKTKKEGNVYKNVLILQHDKELIMPGDAAFNVECDFSKPQEFTVKADFHSKNTVISRITLTDADPAVKSIDSNEKFTVENYTNNAISPESVRQRKEEL